MPVTKSELHYFDERTMQRQIRPCLFRKSLICIVCYVSIAISTSAALALESEPESCLSSNGFSEQQFVDEIKEYLGTPYRKGGTTRKGMDCSGFARTVYERLLGLELPHSSSDQFQSSELQKIKPRELQAGDLVFFANKKKKRINHVGVYLADGQFIHASSSEGIIVSSLNESYWKKRFVGSKRHMALTSTEGDDYRFETFTEMALHESGVLTYYSRDEFNSTTPLPDSPDTINYLPFEIPTTNSNPRNFHEIGYNQSLFPGIDISVSAFREKFSTDHAWPEIGSAIFSQDNYLGENFDTSVRQGLTLSSDYRPSSWLSFTPSVTYFDHSGNDDRLTALPTRTLGLNTQLSPLDNSWSLSMLLQYTDGKDLTNITHFDNRISSLDLAIKLGISLSDNLQFSIMSKHDKRTSAYNLSDVSAFDQGASSDVALVFDFSY